VTCAVVTASSFNEVHRVALFIVAIYRLGS
jgi:hypothetical protein